MAVGRAFKEGSNQGFWNDRSKRYRAGIHDKLISNRAYNFLIGLVVFYGLGVNYIVCTQFQQEALSFTWVQMLVGYLVCVILGSILVNVSHNPIVSFLGYNLIVVPLGLVVSRTLVHYQMKTINNAILATAVITALMLLMATLFPSLFSGLGKILFVSLICLILGRAIMTFCFHQYHVQLLEYLGVAIFTLYIGYDWQRANRYAKTVDNAVDSACDIYMDIINLFLHLLRIFGRDD